MRLYFLVSCLLCLLSVLVPAQERTAEETVHAFFDAFNQKDTVQLRQLIHADMSMMSSYIDQKGDRTNDVRSGHYLIGFMGKAIKKKYAFKEVVSNIRVQKDRLVATVFMDYTMFVGDQLDKVSHCGVNAFTLIKNENDSWVVSFIADSRYTECQSKSKSK